MKKIIYSLILFGILALNSEIIQAQTTLNTTTVSGFSNNNGSGTVTFNFQNTNSYPVTITEIEGISGTSGTMSADIWYKTTPVSAAPGAISTANGWVLGATGSFTAVANSSTLTTQVILTGITVVIPGGVTYGMAISTYTGTTGTQRYHSMVSPNVPLTTISGGGVNILMGDNISFAGNAPPTAPTNTPRAWLGKITFTGQNLRNDAGISAINSPTTPITAGVYNITATLKNYGKDTLKSTSLRWSVNGVLQTSPSNWSGALVQNTTAGPLTFGSYTFTNGNYTIKAWTVNPNGVLDSNKMNDTTIVNIVSCSPLNGTYVIDKAGTGDFLTFNDAVNKLKTCGLTGPVRFRVKAGTYSEKLEIIGVTGTSATNTVTFESYTLDSTSVVLTYAGTTTTDNFVLRFNAVTYFTFKNMTILATGTTYGRAVEYINVASYDNLLNNVIQSPVTTTSTVNPIYSYTTLDQYNTISNNLIIGGYYGIYWYGVSTASMELGNVIIGNTVKDFYYYGIYSYYQNAIQIKKNTITNSSTSGSVYGLYSAYGYNSVDYSYNKIVLNASSTIYGMYLTSNVGTTTLHGKVSNNFISTGGTSTTTVYGMTLSTVSYHDVSFNSVLINNASTTSRCFYITAGTASTTTVRNNIFANLGGGFAIYTGAATTALGTCNYNDLYTTGTVLGYWTANTADLAAWKTASAKDANSISVTPKFYTTDDLHVNNSALNALGTTISGITDDIDGETRLSTPDIGADEFTVTNNDAGVSALVSPLYFCPGGSNSVSVKVKNYGNTTLTSVTVNWQVNGLTQTPATFSVSLAQYQETTLSIGTYSFAAGIRYDLKFWTTLPNTVTDENTRNDVFWYKNLSSVLSGTYTIGGSGAGNYTSFTAAVTDLANKGICGPVVFNVAKGTYTERIVIPQITGASAINTITFKATNPDSVKLTYLGTSTLLATVLLNGADYINFKNISIENTGATYGYAACLMAGANYNTFNNCKILLSTTTTSSTVAGIISTGTETSVATYADNANYTTVNNCTVTGGYYGIRFNGTSTTVKCTGNKVTNCNLTQIYYYGIYYYYTTNDTISNNSLTQWRYTSAYAIYHYYGGDKEQINGNTIINAYYGIYDYYSGNYGTVIGNIATGAYYGFYCYGNGSATPSLKCQITDNYFTASYMGMYMYYHNGTTIERNYSRAGYTALYLYYENYSGNDSTTIYNNMLIEGGGTSYTYGYGLLLGYSGRVNIYHNTMQTDTSYTSSSTSYGACRINYCSYGPIRIKNNIFRTFGNNMACFTTDAVGIANGDLDYNIYYAAIPSNPLAYWVSTAYTSLSVWKTAMPLINKNSLNVDPQLTSKFNLHVKTGAIFYKGVRVGIPIDKDKDARCIPVPTIGADEYIHPYDKPKADFIVDSAICKNSPYVFYNKAGLNDPKNHFWFVNGVFKSNEINFLYTFPKVGKDTIMLITQNCSATDTMIKYITVQLPTSAPVSYFIADKNNVEVFETIKLNDYSTNCPETWKWSITPDTVFDATVGGKVRTYTFIKGNETSINPQIAFLYSGKYTICLTTSNSFSKGSTYCLTNYIEVKPTATFCIYPFDTRDSTGTLYDDGGYLNPYTANKSCGIYIHPCASSVSLVFKTFDIATDDYVRIFDGSDAKGTPLWDASLYPSGLNNGTKIPNPADTFTAKSGKIYIDLISNASTQASGFAATWLSKSVNFSKPVASFDIGDTICNGIPIIFKNTSTGTQVTASWDFDNDGWFDNFDYDGNYNFMWDGDYNVKLVLNSCGGADTFMKHVYVNTPVLPPQFDLKASNPRPNIFSEKVNIFENTIKNCVDSAIWSITPARYTLVSGNLNRSTQLVMKFNDTVCYDFSVIGSYHGMPTSMYFPCFIKPVLYCNPVATTLSTDIGISRVVMNSINNNTAIGQSEYSDFTTTLSTDLERGALIHVDVSRNTNFNPINHKIWIDYNIDGSYDDATEVVAQDYYSSSLTWNATFKLPMNLPFGNYRMRIGTSFGNNANTPCGPNAFGEYEDYRFNVIGDITKPVITLNGAAVINISECNKGFKDPGATAFDNVDGNLTDSIITNGSFNPNLAGTYIITYDVKDAVGNLADQVQRTIIVNRETVAPQLALKGNPVENLQVYHSYTDAGYTASDTCSGLDTVEINNNVDTAMLGVYTVKYTAYDVEGNFAEVTRTINVFDTISPVISSTSNDTITMSVHHLLAKPLYTASDNYYTKVDVEILGSYYVNFPNGEAGAIGYYTLIYKAIDGSGNNNSIHFIIHVVDVEKPELQLNGNGMYIICRFDTLNDPGYTVKDNYDIKPKVIKSGTYVSEYLPNRTVGNFDLIYTAIDNSGNKTIAYRYIVVTDQGSCASSIDPSVQSGSISIFPNPGNGNFNIAFNIGTKQMVPVTIINSLGETLYQSVEAVNPGEVLNFDKQDWKPGMYYIRINLDGKEVSLKYNLVK